MQNINKSLRVCNNNILKWASNNRIIMIYILLMILVYFYSKELIHFSRSMTYNIMPCIFPFLLNGRISKYLIMIGIIVLFYDAPFVDINEKYVIIRTGKKNWATGMIIYIMIAAAIYFFILTIFSIIVFSPNVFFANSWGKLMNTAALNPMKSVPLYIDYTILKTYTPLQAYLTSFFLNWCAATTIGLIMFLVNIYFKPYMGVIAALVIISMDVFFEPTAILTIPYEYIYISPLSLTNLMAIEKVHFGLLLSFHSIVAYFIGIIAILSISIIWLAPKADIYK